MSYLVILRRQAGAGRPAEEQTVRYEAKGLAGGEPAEGTLVLRAGALPDPPPEELRLTIAWAKPAEAGRATLGRTPAGASERRKLAKGDRVEVIKSRVSGVKNPPEWLEQYLGRTGVVLWTTADGAMVDLDPENTWFSFDELRSKE